MASAAEILPSLATSIVTAVVTAMITVRLSIKQFKSQAWWERKVDAYSKIIEALQAMHRFATEAFDAGAAGRELASDYENRLRAQSSAGRDELQRAIGYGSLVISRDAYRALMTLDDELDAARREPYWVERMDLEASAVGQCLGEIRRLAAEDLDVARTPKLALKVRDPAT